MFCQNFTAGLPGIGETISVPLKEDGDDTMVTEENRREYVDLFVDFHLNRSVNKQVTACGPSTAYFLLCQLQMKLAIMNLLP